MIKWILQWSLEFVTSVYVPKLLSIITRKVHLSIKVNTTYCGESSFRGFPSVDNNNNNNNNNINYNNPLKYCLLAKLMSGAVWQLNPVDPVYRQWTYWLLQDTTQQKSCRLKWDRTINHLNSSRACYPHSHAPHVWARYYSLYGLAVADYKSHTTWKLQTHYSDFCSLQDHGAIS